MEIEMKYRNDYGETMMPSINDPEKYLDSLVLNRGHPTSLLSTTQANIPDSRFVNLICNPADGSGGFYLDLGFRFFSNVGQSDIIKQILGRSISTIQVHEHDSGTIRVAGHNACLVMLWGNELPIIQVRAYVSASVPPDDEVGPWSWKSFTGKQGSHAESKLSLVNLRPEVMEIWQGRSKRLHDRTLFRRTSKGWERVGRLDP